MKRLAALVALAACGCLARAPLPGASAPSAPPPPGQPASPSARLAGDDPEGPLTVQVRLRAQRDRIAFDVAPDDTLRTGDRVELYVTVTHRAYVRVLQLLPDGTPGVLDLVAGEVALEPGGATRIPAAASEWYELDEVAGTETVYVIASRAPLGTLDAAFAEQIRAIRAPAAPAPPSAPAGSTPRISKGAAPVPPRVRPAPRSERMLTTANRGLRKVVVTAGRSVIAPADPIAGGRLVVAWLSFHHER
jgi:hypothetical protein